MKIAVIGTVCMDLVVRSNSIPKGEEDLIGSVEPMPGGNALNSAYVLGKLGNSVSLYSRIGKDMHGSAIVNYTTSIGIDPRLTISGKTGICLCFVQEGQRSFLYDPGSYSEFSEKDIGDEIFSNDAILVNGYSTHSPVSVVDLFKKARKKGIITAIDALHERDISKELGQTDILFANESEIERIKGHEKAKTVIIKRGEDGCRILSNGKVIDLPANPAEAIDTTGAGDAFNAAFLSEYLKTRDLGKSGKLANQIASRSVSSIGGTGFEINGD